MIKYLFSGRPKGVLYVVDSEGNLIWYRHRGWQDGNANWDNGGQGKIVGNGFFFEKMFAGAGNQFSAESILLPIYGINSNGDLMWYYHADSSNGSFKWEHGEGAKVGWVWSPFVNVFSSTNKNVIYGVHQNGQLWWYMHYGHCDGSFNWSNGGNHAVVGSGWNRYSNVIAGDWGIIYGIDPNGDLMWYKHHGYDAGILNWANGGVGVKVGTGWNMFTHVVSAGDGIIYGIKPNGDLMWYKHFGADNGIAAAWSNGGSGFKVGNLHTDGKEIW